MSRLDRIEDWLEQARKSRFHAAALASLCQVSFSQLRRFTLLRVQKTPQRWLDDMRLDEAARMILTSELSLKQIALELHFADQSHFSHQFKKRFGCKPSEYGGNYAANIKRNSLAPSSTESLP